MESIDQEQPVTEEQSNAIKEFFEKKRDEETQVTALAGYTRMLHAVMLMEASSHIDVFDKQHQKQYAEGARNSLQYKGAKSHMIGKYENAIRKEQRAIHTKNSSLAYLLMNKADEILNLFPKESRKRLEECGMALSYIGIKLMAGTITPDKLLSVVSLLEQGTFDQAFNEVDQEKAKENGTDELRGDNSELNSGGGSTVDNTISTPEDLHGEGDGSEQCIDPSLVEGARDTQDRPDPDQENDSAHTD